MYRSSIGKELFESIRYSRLARVADSYKWSKKTYNNTVSALRCAFEYAYRDFPEKHNPALALRCLRITKKDRPPIDPFTIQEAEALIAAIHRDCAVIPERALIIADRFGNVTCRSRTRSPLSSRCHALTKRLPISSRVPAVNADPLRNALASRGTSR